MAHEDASDWTIVTVTYNSEGQLEESWRTASIGAATWLVVDNASGDGSVAVATSLGATVVRNPTNVGFGAGCNVGLDRVTSPWVAFVNPDVTIGSPTELARLADTGRMTKGLVAPQLTHPDGTLQPNARGLPFPSAKLANRGIRLPGSRLNDYVRTGFGSPTYIAWAMGAAIAGPTELFRRLGGWDPGYFIYYEDHDLGLRSWGGGHPVVLEPRVLWRHTWQRETTKLRLSPWKHEYASGRRFYDRYPQLRTRRRATQDQLMSRISSLLWTSPDAEQPDEVWPPDVS